MESEMGRKNKYFLPLGILVVLVVIAFAQRMSNKEREDNLRFCPVPTEEPAQETTLAPDNVADIVLGQENMDQAIANGLDSMSIVQPCWVAVDSSVEPYRLYIVDSGNYRVLGYSHPATEKPPVSADLVLCQRNFKTAFFFEEETGPEKVWMLYSIAVDASGNVFLSDSSHNRVLEYDRPFETDTHPDRVFGQPDFESLDPDCTAVSLGQPGGICVDKQTGTLWVADTANNRVLAYFNPLTSDATADFVLGQQGQFDTRLQNSGGRSARTFSAPVSVDVKGEDIVVSDLGNNRILVFKDPVHTDDVADYVLGQESFETAERGCNPRRFMLPEDILIDATGRIMVSDSRNHRMLLYPPPDSPQFQPVGLWGQWQSLHTNEPNFRGLGPESLHFPVGLDIAPDGTLWLADRENHRVLGYQGGTEGDKAADYVIGQVDLHHNTPNLVDGNCMFFPRDVAVDRTVEPNRLYAVDFENSRVLAYESVDDLNNEDGAAFVLGQKDQYSADYSVGPSSFNLCSAVAVGLNGGVYVADRENSRVVWFENPFENDKVGDAVIGQPDFDSSLANAGGVVSATTLNRPEGVTVDSEGNLYVADSRNHRVLRFDKPLETDFVADQVWGQLGRFDSGEEYGGQGVGPETLSYPFKLAVSEAGVLAVADTNNHRVLLFDTRSAAPCVPVKVLGQMGDFHRNRDCIGQCMERTLSGPEGAVFWGKHLYVSDTAACRVLFFKDVMTSDDVADEVYGQYGKFTTGSIGVGRISAENLWFPSGIDLDTEGNLYVADREQSRVVVFKRE